MSTWTFFKMFAGHEYFDLYIFLEHSMCELIKENFRFRSVCADPYPRFIVLLVVTILPLLHLLQLNRILTETSDAEQIQTYLPCPDDQEDEPQNHQSNTCSKHSFSSMTATDRVLMKHLIHSMECNDVYFFIIGTLCKISVMEIPKAR